MYVIALYQMSFSVKIERIFYATALQQRCLRFDCFFKLNFKRMSVTCVIKCLDVIANLAYFNISQCFRIKKKNINFDIFSVDGPSSMNSIPYVIL